MSRSRTGGEEATSWEDASSRFWKMVATDLTHLADAWEVLPPGRREAVVGLLLREDPRYRRKWPAVARYVAVMEAWVSLAGLARPSRGRLDEIRAESASLDDKEFLAGMGCPAAGRLALGGRPGPLGLSGPRVREAVKSLRASPVASSRVLLGDCTVPAGGSTRGRTARHQFEDWCLQAFRDGKRTQVAETGRLGRERRELGVLLDALPDRAGFWGCLTRAQREGARAYACSEVEVIPSWVGVRAARGIARELILRARRWRAQGPPEVPPRSLDARGMIARHLARSCSTEETFDWYSGTHAGKRGRPAYSEAGYRRLLRSLEAERPGTLPDPDFPAHRELLASSHVGPRRGRRDTALGEGLFLPAAETRSIRAGLRRSSKEDVTEQSRLLLPLLARHSRRVPRDHREVLRALAKGRRQADVAADMGLTQGGVSRRLSRTGLVLRELEELGGLPGLAEARRYFFDRMSYVRDESVRRGRARVLAVLVDCAGCQRRASGRTGVLQCRISALLSEFMEKGGPRTPGHPVTVFLERIAAAPYAYRFPSLPGPSGRGKHANRGRRRSFHGGWHVKS